MNEQSISFRFGVSAAPAAVTVGHRCAAKANSTAMECDALYDHSTISSASKIVATEINVDLYPDDQRAGRSQFDHHFRDVDIREIALSSRAEAAGSDDLRDRGNLAGEIATGKCGTTTGCPAR